MAAQASIMKNGYGEIKGRIMVLRFCHSPHCHLFIYQGWFKCQH